MGSNSYRPPESAEDLLRRYGAGERYFTEIELLNGASFFQVNLEGASFEGCFMADLDFREANLKHVKFSNCNLKCSDFRGADLQYANFKGSSVEAIFLGDANLEGVSFQGAYYYGVELQHGEIP